MGRFTNRNVGIHGGDYTPTIPIESEVVAAINEIMGNKGSLTYKALKYMYYAMRTQLFWDGNKCTAIFSANAIMMLNGLEIVNICEQQLEYWNQLLSEFYETNNGEKIIQWTYANCVHGIDY